jgi:hypothetical protein
MSSLAGRSCTEGRARSRAAPESQNPRARAIAAYEWRVLVSHSAPRVRSDRLAWQPSRSVWSSPVVRACSSGCEGSLAPCDDCRARLPGPSWSYSRPRFIHLSHAMDIRT